MASRGRGARASVACIDLRVRFPVAVAPLAGAGPGVRAGAARAGLLTFAVALLAFATPRLLVFLWLQPWTPEVARMVVEQPYTDSSEYDQLARDLAATHQFVRNGAPEQVRTPLYPLFVALCYAAWGPRPWIPLLAQTLLLAAAMAFFVTVVARLAGRRVALATCALAAVEPLLLLFPLSLMSECLFLAFCLLGTGLLLRTLGGGERGPCRWLRLGAAGAAYGLAVLTRPVAEYAVVILALVAWAAGRRAGLGARSSLAFLAGSALVVAPWVARNALTFGVVAVSPVGSYTLLDDYVAPAEAQRRSLPLDQVMASLADEAYAWMARDGIAPTAVDNWAESRYAGKVAFHYITAEPLLIARQCAIGVFRTAFGVATGSFRQLLGVPSNAGAFDLFAYHDPWSLTRAWLAHVGPAEAALGLAFAAYNLVVYGLAALAVVAVLRARPAWARRAGPLLAACACLAIYFMLIDGPAGDARMRLPATPFYLVWAGAGAVALAEALGRARRERRVTPPPLGRGARSSPGCV